MAQFLTPVDLETERTPQLLQGEALLGRPFEGVQLLNDGGDAMAVGLAVLTTARLVVIFPGRQGPASGRVSSTNAGGVELADLEVVARGGGGPLGLGLLMPKGLDLTFRTSSRMAPDRPSALLKLAFEDGDARDELHDALTRALQKLRIENSTLMTPRGTPRAAPDVLEELQRAGSDGRLRRLIVVYENARRPVMDFSEHPQADRGFHHASLLPGERPQFSDSEGEIARPDPGNPSGQAELDKLKPEGWEWEGEARWQVLTEAGRTDEEGWEYAWNFTRKLLSPVNWTPDMRESFGNKSWVRRRRWVRPCVQPETAARISGSIDAGQSFDSVKKKLPRGILERTGDVSVSFLEENGGGPAKTGWLWKEGKLIKNWELRYWVLWPAEQDPVQGRLLFYFQAQDSLKPQGVVHVPCQPPGIQVRTPKTLRPKYKCRRVECDQVVDVAEGGMQALVTEKRKIIIGADKEEELIGWTRMLRAGLDGNDGAQEQTDHEGWLFKRNPNGIAWWKLRWFQLCGTRLKYWDSETQHEAGTIDLTKYSVRFPNLESFEALQRLEHRAFEIMLIPKPTGTSDASEGQLSRQVSQERDTALTPRFLAADDEDSFTKWQAALLKVCQPYSPGDRGADTTWEVVVPDGAGQLHTTTMAESELVEAIRLSQAAPGETAAHGVDAGVSIHHFDQLSVLGKGGFGKVLLVRKCDTKQQFAMKILLKSFIIEKQEVEHTKVERDILKEVDHPFLVKLHYAFQTSTKLYLIVDFVSGGELYFHLRNRGRQGFSAKETQFFLAELALALGCLHSLGIIYRDLKPENVLIDHDGHIKLTDFGLAKKNVSEQNRPTTFCGTPLYLAPEAIKTMRSSKGYGMEVDWCVHINALTWRRWTFGALMYEMLTGEPPFTAGSIKELLHVIVNNPVVIPDKIRSKSTLAADCIEQLLHKDPTQRLGHGGGEAASPSLRSSTDGTCGTTTGVEEIKAHPFFGGIDWQKLLAKDPSIEPPFKPASSKSNPLLHFDKKMTAMKMTALSLHESGGAGGGTLAVTQSRDPFADFGYDGVVPLPEPELEPEPETADALPPPIQDSSEVGVPPVSTATGDGESSAMGTAASTVAGSDTATPMAPSADPAAVAAEGAGGSDAKQFLTAAV